MTFIKIIEVAGELGQEPVGAAAGTGPDQQLAALLLSADTTVRSDRDSELHREISVACPRAHGAHRAGRRPHPAWVPFPHLADARVSQSVDAWPISGGVCGRCSAGP